MFAGSERMVGVDFRHVFPYPYRRDVKHRRNPVRCRGGAASHIAGEVYSRCLREKHILRDVGVGENDTARVDDDTGT